MPQELKQLSREQCEQRLKQEGKTFATSLSDDELRLLLEACLSTKYCELFVPAMAAGVAVYLALAGVVSDGYALLGLALPAPMILALRGARLRMACVV
mmetsp:Transcript_10246/g.24217  ORF Transcript_10246/g.24217 Transcript_10246/m.24217 type:complete len:98 (+) Transcript_10246:3-296(+)